MQKNCYYLIYTQIILNNEKLNDSYEGINPIQFKKYFMKYNNYLFLDQVYLVNDYVFYLNNDDEYSQGVITKYKINKDKEIIYTIQDDNVTEKPIKINNDNIITKLNTDNQNVIQSNIYLFNKKKLIIKKYFHDLIKKDLLLQKKKQKQIIMMEQKQLIEI